MEGRRATRAVQQPMDVSQALLDYVLAHVDCLLWHAAVEEVSPGVFDWRIAGFDEAAAQRFMPLELGPGETYMEALQRNKDPVVAARMNRVWEEVVATGGSQYAQDFGAQDRDGGLRWLH